jgi:hypothetical protein
LDVQRELSQRNDSLMQKVQTVLIGENVKIALAVLEEMRRSATHNEESQAIDYLARCFYYRFGEIETADVPRVEAYQVDGPAVRPITIALLDKLYLQQEQEREECASAVNALLAKDQEWI